MKTQEISKKTKMIFSKTTNSEEWYFQRANASNLENQRIEPQRRSKMSEEKSVYSIRR